MNKGVWKIAKVNLQNIKVTYFTVGIIVLATMVQSVILLIIAGAGGDMGGQSQVSWGCYFWLLPMLAAVFIPLKNFSRIVNLGGKRDNFIWGSLVTYGLLSLVAAVANTAVYFLFDRFVMETGYFDRSVFGGSINIIDVFGWAGNGAVIALIQQFVFLLFLSVVIHTLVAIQDKWYGWVTDIVLAAIISVFVPIEPLRNVLVGFFYFIIFQPTVLLQIAVCLILAILIYALNKPIFAKKVI